MQLLQMNKSAHFENAKRRVLIILFFYYNFTTRMHAAVVANTTPTIILTDLRSNMLNQIYSSRDFARLPTQLIITKNVLRLFPIPCALQMSSE